VAVYNPKGSCHVKLSVISHFVYMHIKVECEAMFYVIQYITEYILAEAYDISYVNI